jgi:hypothetical protein
MNIEFLKSSEKKEIMKDLEEIYGITELPYLLIKTGKDRIRAFSGNLSKQEIMELGSFLNVELIGQYIIRKENSPRLSLDATNIFEIKNQITKSIIHLNKEEYEQWIRGRDIPTEKENNIYVIEYDGIYLGSGVANNKKLINHMPKSRRLKTNLNQLYPEQLNHPDNL